MQPTSSEPWLELFSSRHFPAWLAEQNVGLAFSTYQTGKLFMVGRNPQGQLGVFERTFNRCMGLCRHESTLWMSTLFQLWRLENLLEAGNQHQGHDRLFVPMAGYTTGDIDVHDVAVDGQGRVVFVSTLFSCLGTIAERASFTPIWRPPFISKLAAEDRCHLNGLAMIDGQPRYVTASSTSDVVDGWRDRRRDGGVLIDVAANQVITRGLSMPHSPRHYRGELFLLNSGVGFFGKVDLASGKFEPIAFVPGYARGLDFVGDYAVIGISGPRHDKTFTGLPLDAEMKARGAEPRVGLTVIDLRSGDAVHWLRLEGLVQELYDVVTLPGAVRPMVLGFKTEEIQRLFIVGPERTLGYV